MHCMCFCSLLQHIVIALSRAQCLRSCAVAPCLLSTRLDELSATHGHSELIELIRLLLKRLSSAQWSPLSCRTCANLGAIVLLIALVVYLPQLVKPVTRDVISAHKAIVRVATSAFDLCAKGICCFLGMRVRPRPSPKPSPDVSARSDADAELRLLLAQLSTPQLAFIAEARGLKVTPDLGQPMRDELIWRLLLTAPRGVARHGTFDLVKSAGIRVGIPQTNMNAPSAWQFQRGMTQEQDWRRRLHLLEDPLTCALVHHILHPHTARTRTAGALC